MGLGNLGWSDDVWHATVIPIPNQTQTHKKQGNIDDTNTTSNEQRMKIGLLTIIDA